MAKITTKTKRNLLIIGVVLALLVVILLVYYLGASYPAFYSIAEKEFNIPGLNTSFTPQGLTYSEKYNKFLLCGYMNNGSPSRIYIVDKESNETSGYFTLTIEGSSYNGHSGGIATDGDYAWISGEGTVYRFSLSSALSLENAQSLEIIDSFETGNGADFLVTYQNKLIVGEFFHKIFYKTPKEHHIETANKSINRALSFIYTINQDMPCGIEQAIPEAGISMPSKVQGMSFTKNGNIILSTSYALSDSKLFIYENVLNSQPTATATLSENLTIPVYMLDSSTLLETLTAPCMSEELVLVEGRVYILFESNCSKYRIFTRTRLSHVYSIDI